MFTYFLSEDVIPAFSLPIKSTCPLLNGDWSGSQLIVSPHIRAVISHINGVEQSKELCSLWVIRIMLIAKMQSLERKE